MVFSLEKYRRFKLWEPQPLQVFKWQEGFWQIMRDVFDSEYKAGQQVSGEAAIYTWRFVGSYEWGYSYR